MIKAKNRSVFLLINLFPRVAKFVTDFQADILASSDTVSHITDRIYRHDPLSVTAPLFQRQQALFATGRGLNETFVASQ